MCRLLKYKINLVFSYFDLITGIFYCFIFDTFFNLIFLDSRIFKCSNIDHLGVSVIK